MADDSDGLDLCIPIAGYYRHKVIDMVLRVVVYCIGKSVRKMYRGTLEIMDKRTVIKVQSRKCWIQWVCEHDCDTT